MQVWIDHAFSVAHDIAISGNLKTLIAVPFHHYSYCFLKFIVLSKVRNTFCLILATNLF
ncbi:hypothetical protein Hanom_Chr15g01390081 [Helianthus anomalus]